VEASLQPLLRSATTTGKGWKSFGLRTDVPKLGVDYRGLAYCFMPTLSSGVLARHARKRRGTTPIAHDKRPIHGQAAVVPVAGTASGRQAARCRRPSGTSSA